MHVYEKVRLYIDDNHLKQVSVAKMAGISTAAFDAMLNGQKMMYAAD